MAFYQLKTEQFIPAKLEEVWDFISSPSNLKVITPDHMGFDITSEGLSKKMYPGMIISYKVSPIFKIKMTWVTEITHVVDKKFFIDDQRVGPYAMWHHQHHIKEVEGGVLMNDIISYRPPMGFLGSIANSLFIKKQLQGIFDYRFQAVEKYFNKKHPNK